MDIEKLAGERIALAMKLKGWGREKFAEELGKSPTYISQLVRGETNLGIKTLKNIAEVLGQPMAFFVEENYSINLGASDLSPKKAPTERHGKKQAAH